MTTIATTVKSDIRPFPFLDLKAQYQTIRPEIDAAIRRVIEAQYFILGPEVDNFEKELAVYSHTGFGIGCASGSDALLLALMALEIGPGDEVITTPFTFVATAGAIARLRATPVFVDIDPISFNIEPEAVRSAVTAKTKAIIPVHLFGMSASMDRIMTISEEHHIPVIEDAAQAIGAEYDGRPVGSIGLCGCFSFFPSKNLGGAGDGGMLTTNDKALADKLRVLRTHGSRTKYDYELLGMNSRLDSLQAAILRVKLQHLDTWAAGRQRNAGRYTDLFQSMGLNSIITLPKLEAKCNHIYNQYVVRVPRRDELKKHLLGQGVPTEIYYPIPLHLQRAFAYLGYKVGDMPESEAASKEVLALPVFPEMKEEQLKLVVESVASFYSNL